MSTTLIILILVTWVIFIPLAILNGVVRESWYRSHVGELAAHQISTVIAILAYFALVFIMFRTQVAVLSPQTLLMIGGIWVGMTIVFEFGFGRFVEGKTWGWLLQDYNLPAGRIWLLFLAAVFLSPYLLKLLLA